MAGKFFNKFLNFIGLEENIIEEETDLTKDRLSEKYYDGFDKQSFHSSQKKGKVVNLHTSSHIKVVVYQPISYDDTQNIIDNLKSRKPVIVNLDSLDADLAQRVLDFISGAVYSLDGTIQKISRGIFIIAPSNVDVSGNIPDDLKGKSFYTLSNNESISDLKD